jgi:ABC-type nitrate/sulfonate/bicarbonate transport system ATPase subunit
MMSNDMVILENVHHEFSAAGRPLPVIGSLDFSVGTGELFCVLGPSGCGKTTILHLVAGFLTPTGGRIIVSGHPITGPGPDRALVFQQPTLFPWLTTAGNIDHALRRPGKPFDSRVARRRRLAELVALVGLQGFEHTYPHRLSGGMQQRVALARALALEPRVLLLDEPFAALDPLIRERLQDELLRLRSEVGCTMIFVTHNIQEAAYLGDRIMVLSRRPARITRLMNVGRPHPRRRTDEQLWKLERELYLHCGCCSETPDLHVVRRSYTTTEHAIAAEKDTPCSKPSCSSRTSQG